MAVDLFNILEIFHIHKNGTIFFLSVGILTAQMYNFCSKILCSFSVETEVKSLPLWSLKSGETNKY